MKLLSNFFKHKKVFIPVVHVETLQQAIRNTEYAQLAGADGVFLINHRIDDDELLQIAGTINIRPQSKDWFVGVNCLGMIDTDVMEAAANRFKGIWVDNAFPKQDYVNYADKMSRMVAPYTNLYFGGVAFKYQKPIQNLEEACKVATKFVDVVTTSGPATGQPPNLEKIMEMKGYLGDHPLAIASGIDADNVESFLPYVDCFLVSTSVSKSFSEFDFDKLIELADKVHAGD
jgi:predicted TIM-barrel enzyme